MDNARQLFDLSGRTALVTGGSRGLGLEMATALGQAGASVIVTARRAEWLRTAEDGLRELGIEARAIACDVSGPEEVSGLVESIVREQGGLDILINAAGISWGAPAVDMPVERWRSVMDTNATGTFVCCQAVAPHMIERGRGRIINIASIAGMVGQDSRVMDAVGYSASKGAVIALTRDLAVKWARHGINVNAIAPGFFPSRMTRTLLDRNEAAIAALSPSGRVGRPGELMGAAVFLAADASSYITGQILAVDGGYTAW